MVARADEHAEKTGTFHCADCDVGARVEKGDRIPRCPCGSNTFDRRTDEPGR